MLAFHLIFVLYTGYVLLKMSIFLQNWKAHAKNTRIYTYNHHSNEPLLAAILASAKYGHVYLQLSFQFIWSSLGTTAIVAWVQSVSLCLLCVS